VIIFGAIAGLAAGLVASAVMEGFQAAWTKAREALGGASPAGGAGGQGAPGKVAAAARRGGAVSSDPAPVKVAAAATSTLSGDRLTKARKEPAGRIVHYLFGAGSAILYGALAEVAPVVTLGFGSLFGVAVWVFADNLLLWAIGLSKRPTAYPLSTHVYSLASHVVYGVAVEAVRQLVRPVLPA